MEDSLPQLRRGVLGYCVLSALRSQPRYGFELSRGVEIDGFGVPQGTIYPLLSRLKRDGLVVSEWRESSGGPPRKYYRLTEKGQLELDRFIQEWRRFRDAVDRALEVEGEG